MQPLLFAFLGVALCTIAVRVARGIELLPLAGLRELSAADLACEVIVEHIAPPDRASSSLLSGKGIKACILPKSLPNPSGDLTIRFAGVRPQIQTESADSIDLLRTECATICQLPAESCQSDLCASHTSTDQISQEI
jgi:hypothetical protein